MRRPWHTTQHYAKILDLKVSNDMRILKEKFGDGKHIVTKAAFFICIIARINLACIQNMSVFNLYSDKIRLNTINQFFINA